MTPDLWVTVTPATGEEFRFDPSILERLPPIPDEVDRAMRDVTYDGIQPPIEPIRGIIVRIGANPVFEGRTADGLSRYDYDVAYRQGSSWKVVSIIGFPSSAYTVDAVTLTGERIPGAFQTLDLEPSRQQVIHEGVIIIPGLQPIYPGSPVTVYLSTGPESGGRSGYENTRTLSEFLGWPIEQSMGTVFYQAPTS